MQLMEAEHPEVLSFDLWSDMKKDMLFSPGLLDELSGYNNGEKDPSEPILLSSVSLGNRFQRPFFCRPIRISVHRSFSRKTSLR